MLANGGLANRSLAGTWRGDGGQPPGQGNRTLAPASWTPLPPASCLLTAALLLLLLPSWACRKLVGRCGCGYMALLLGKMLG